MVINSGTMHHINYLRSEKMTQDEKDRLTDATEYYISLLDDGHDNDFSILTASKRYSVSSNDIFENLYLG